MAGVSVMSLSKYATMDVNSVFVHTILGWNIILDFDI